MSALIPEPRVAQDHDTTVTFVPVGGGRDTLGTLLITTDDAVIGREGSVVLDAPTVSRRHAHIFRHGSQIWIEDRGSANGTMVNGVRIRNATQLFNGDTVRFGDVETIFTGLSLDLPHRPSRPDASSETTRYLSAAVHLDPRFCAPGVECNVPGPVRALGRSQGVALSVVARHCVPGTDALGYIGATANHVRQHGAEQVVPERPVDELHGREQHAFRTNLETCSRLS